ncbi:MAG TPA: hypothetical protein VF095_01570 [Bacillota bacterium]
MYGTVTYFTNRLMAMIMNGLVIDQMFPLDEYVKQMQCEVVRRANHQGEKEYYLNNLKIASEHTYQTLAGKKKTRWEDDEH